MRYDDTIKAVLQEVQEECKKEFKKDFSIEELFEIANSQFVGGAVANDMKISFFISYIGNFVFKNYKALSASIRSIEALKDKVSEEEYERIVKEKRIANMEVMKPSKLKLITKLEDLPETVIESRGLAAFNKLYKKVINSND